MLYYNAYVVNTGNSDMATTPAYTHRRRSRGIIRTNINTIDIENWDKNFFSGLVAPNSLKCSQRYIYITVIYEVICKSERYKYIVS